MRSLEPTLFNARCRTLAGMGRLTMSGSGFLSSIPDIGQFFLSTFDLNVLWPLLTPILGVAYSNYDHVNVRQTLSDRIGHH